MEPERAPSEPPTASEEPGVAPFLTSARTPEADDWTSAGVYEAAPGVHRVPLPLPNDGLRAVNVYAIEDTEGLVLVDAGWAISRARQELSRAVEALGYALSDITRFLITHVHRDHYTQAVSLRREYGMPVSLGAGERVALETLQAPERRTLEPQLSQLRRHGAAELADRLKVLMGEHPSTDRKEWEMPDDWLRPGLLTLPSGRTLEVVATPGHTRGHLVFHDPAAGLLFAGDHVLPRITPSIGFEPVLSENPLGDFLRSLAHVRQMPDAVLLPAHGPVTPSVHARIDELVDHHGRRLDQTEAVVSAGVGIAFEVARGLRWTRRQRALDELDTFNQSLAVAETVAHLDLLVAQGRLTKSLEGGIWAYRPA